MPTIHHSPLALAGLVAITLSQIAYADEPEADRYVTGVILGASTISQFGSHWYKGLDSRWLKRQGYVHWRDTLADEEYKNVNKGLESAHPYTIMNLHYAWALGFTGAGQVVAISDNLQFGSPDDPEFAGRIFGCYAQSGTDPDIDCNLTPRNDTNYHARQVMGVAAAARNQSGTVGVAYNAKVLELENEALVQSIDKAMEADAIAFSMSWSMQADKDDHSRSGLLSAIAPYFNRFQTRSDSHRGGVVVVAIANDPEKRNKLADLPYFEEDLQDAWISVANADIRLDETTGEIWVDSLRSAECGLSARWCVLGNGKLRTTGMDVDDDWVDGTSFATPAASGAVAVLAEPFANSTGPELNARLFATANNTMFLPGGRNFDEDRVLAIEKFGVNDCASHTYAPDFGHGVFDLRAALEPICGLVLIVGNDLATGVRVPVGDSLLVGPAEVVAALDGKFDMFVGLVDGINGEFTARMSSFVEKAERNQTTTDKAVETQLAIASEAPSFAYVDHAEGDAIGRLHWRQADAASGMTLRFGVGDDIAAGIDGWSGLGMTSGALSLVGEGGYAGFGLNEGPLAGLEVTSFIGSNAWHDGPVYGVEGRVRKSFGPIDASVGVRLIGETGSYFGLHSASDLWTGSETVLSAVHTHLSHSVTDRVSLVAAGEFGVGYGGDGAFVQYLAPALYSSAAVGVNVKDTLADDDRLWLTLSQPLRLEHAPVRLTLPSGRTIEGDITHETYFRDMAPDRRQLDLGLSYARPLGDTGIAGFAVTHSFNDEHLAGANATNIEAFLSMTF